MIFSVSNDEIGWSFDFGQKSVTLTALNLIQEKTKGPQGLRLAAWSLLLSQKQKYLGEHPARVPVTPNQQGTHEMRDEVIPSLGAQEMDTGGCQVSDPDDVEFYREKDRLNVDAVSRPGNYTPFSPTELDDLEMGVSAENHNLLDIEEDKKNCPPISPVSERPI